MDELREPSCSHREPASEPTQTSGSTQPSRARRLGTGLIWFAVLIVGLVALDRTGTLPFGMPHVWYPLRDLWTVIAFIAGGCGLALLWQEPRLDGWAPLATGRRFHQLILYTRQDCHLCDVAKEVLEIHGQYLPPITEVDIDKDAILIAQFTLCVPVVEIDGKVRFRGHVDQTLLRRLIEGTAPTA